MIENPYPTIESGYPTNDWCYSQYDLAVAFVQGVTALAKWLLEDCDSHGHGRLASQPPAPKRWQCPICWVAVEIYATN